MYRVVLHNVTLDKYIMYSNKNVIFQVPEKTDTGIHLSSIPVFYIVILMSHTNKRFNSEACNYQL